MGYLKFDDLSYQKVFMIDYFYTIEDIRLLKCDFFHTQLECEHLAQRHQTLGQCAALSSSPANSR